MKKYAVNIDELLNKNYTFYAHPNETIKEHTDKCLLFFDNISSAKGTYDIFENMAKELLKEDYDEYRELFWKMFINTIAFHDVGKINPAFQRIKMENAQFSSEKAVPEVGTEHSIISAIIYLQYFLPEIYEIENKKAKVNIRMLAYINAYVISRHHSKLADFQEFINDFKNEEGGKNALKKDAVFHNIKKYINSDIDLFETDYIDKSYKFVYKGFGSDADYNICCYAYERLLYSMLVASDYYATTFQQEGYVQEYYGTIDDIEKLFEIYKGTEVNKNIECFRNAEMKNDISEITDINELRTQIYLRTEKKLLENISENIFYMEAPTGSGKSNTALNLSFQMIKHDKKLNKILYIYPFNTLVEQNEKILKKIFGDDEKAGSQIKVVNSVTPIKEINEDSYDTQECVQALLDRQFFNYPIALSTHVTLFNIMFGGSREDAFSFHQLVGSVVVLDEIQSYKNSIWTEIIVFLKAFAKLLNMKILIMSATLPNLDILSERQQSAVKLLDDSQKFFKNKCFCNRVSEVDYSLLSEDNENLFDRAKELIYTHLGRGEKVLIEFINKKTAEEFFKFCKEDIQNDIYIITGDNNSIERAHILGNVADTPDGTPLLLIATQVIEAGVDIQNIDVGFKDISLLDAEEQFFGRINRSNRGKGKVYFFNYNGVELLYRDDVRKNMELSLINEDMRKILIDKDFDSYYQRVMATLKNINSSLNQKYNIDEFWKEDVGKLNQEKIAKRMRLIDDDNRCCQVYLARKINDMDGNEIDGEEIWNEYKKLLQNQGNEAYAVYKVKLSNIVSKMNYFIYRIKKSDFIYNDRVGEIYYIENGEDYFEDGRLLKEKFETGVGVFI